MNVFLVQGDLGYDGTVDLAVRSSLAESVEFVARQMFENRGTKDGYFYYHITEWEVDGNDLRSLVIEGEHIGTPANGNPETSADLVEDMSYATQKLEDGFRAVHGQVSIEDFNRGRKIFEEMSEGNKPATAAFHVLGRFDEKEACRLVDIYRQAIEVEEAG